MENDNEWGMYYTPTHGRDNCESCSTWDNTQRLRPNLQSQFIPGYEAALGLHMLEGAN